MCVCAHKHVCHGQTGVWRSGKGRQQQKTRSPEHVVICKDLDDEPCVHMSTCTVLTTDMYSIDCAYSSVVVHRHNKLTHTHMHIPTNV